MCLFERLNRYVAGWSVILLCVCSSVVEAQMQTGGAMKNYHKVLGLQRTDRQPDFRAVLLNANAPGCIFYPGTKPQLTFQIQNITDQPMHMQGHLDLIAYGTQSIPGDIWRPEVYLIEDLPDQSLTVQLPANGWKNFNVTVEMPERLGGYAIVLDLGTHGRALLATMVRAMKPDVPLVQLPSQTLEAIEPAVLQQLGVRAVRFGLSYWSSKANGYDQYLRDVDAKMRSFQKHGVTVMVEIGAGNYEQPLGRPRPMLDEHGVMKSGKMDHVWMPSEDDDYQAFVTMLTGKYGWPNGPMTGIMLWNEPWEGTSISGWQADMLRYRELYLRMGKAVHQANQQANVNVLVGGCDSSTNTWDKLFPDGSDTFLPYLDFCSIHYQGMTSPALYRLWNQRKEGRVKVWDTESWVANTDDRVGAVVATNRAAGYDRAMGIYVGNVVTFNNFGYGPDAEVFQANGQKRRQPVFPQAWPPAAALCAVQAMIGERSFKEVLFQNGLPWVYVFDGMNGNPDDGTMVILLDLGSLFASPDSVPFRTVRSLDELQNKAKLQARLAGSSGSERNNLLQQINEPMQFTGASMSIDSDPDFALHDFFGNTLLPEHGKYVIPLDARGFFLRANPDKPGSFAKLLHAVQTGFIKGIEPLEIKMHDFTQALTSEMTLSLELTNVLNRPVQGMLQVTLANVSTQLPMEMQAQQTRLIHVPIAKLQPADDNHYPLLVRFESQDAGVAEQRDTMRVNVIARKHITIDGKLDDWQGALPQMVQAQGTARQSLTEAAWLPFKSFDAGDSGGLATGYLAYDDDYFYFAVKVADRSRDAGTLRFETRDDDMFFYPAVATTEFKEGGKQLHWPQDVRRFSYRRDPILPAGCFPNFDNVQIAFNAIDAKDEADLMLNLPGRPEGFINVLDTDYEYALNTVSSEYGGGFEVWRLRVPGMPSKNFYPRQPKGPLDGPVKSAKLLTTYQGNARVTELAMPWSEIPHVHQLMLAGKPVKFSFHVNNNTGGPLLELGRDRSVTRKNNLSFHVDWQESWSNDIAFGWEQAP